MDNPGRSFVPDEPPRNLQPGRQFWLSCRVRRATHILSHRRSPPAFGRLDNNETRRKDSRVEPLLRVYNTPCREVIRPAGEGMAPSNAGWAGV